MPVLTQRSRITLFASLLVATACGAGLSGRYVDDAGIAVYEFDADGGAQIHVLGATVAAEYTLDGDRVIVSSPQGSVVFRRDGDRLHGPMGLTLVRQTDRPVPVPQQPSVRRRDNDG